MDAIREVGIGEGPKLFTCSQQPNTSTFPLEQLNVKALSSSQRV